MWLFPIKETVLMVGDLDSNLVANLHNAAKNLVARKFRTAIRLACAIPCVTKDRKDVDFAIRMAAHHDIANEDAAEALANLAKALARSSNGHLDLARHVAENMKGMHVFWQAMSRIFIYAKSLEQGDKDKADIAISRITDDCDRLEASNNLHVAVRKSHKERNLSFYSELRRLGVLFSHLEQFRSKDPIDLKSSSMTLRNGIELLISTILQEVS